MSWNHRVVKFTDADGVTHFGVHEVYYDESGRPKMYAESAMAPYGETLEELAQDLKRMQRALDKPVLTDKDFEREKQ